MKTMKVALAIFAVCFICGMGLIAAYPGDANAIGAPPQAQYCNYDCSKIVCKGQLHCGIDYRHYRCYVDIFDFNCVGPWDCDCIYIGCGGACVHA